MKVLLRCFLRLALSWCFETEGNNYLVRKGDSPVSSTGIVDHFSDGPKSLDPRIHFVVLWLRVDRAEVLCSAWEGEIEGEREKEREGERDGRDREKDD